MKDGRIIEQGTHAELIAKGGLYASLWSRQRQAEKAREEGQIARSAEVTAALETQLRDYQRSLEEKVEQRTAALQETTRKAIVLSEQARRAKKLGLTLCMQPNFSTDSVDYADRLSARYLRANNPFRMLIDRAGFVPGTDLVFGSDGMPHGAQAALGAALFPPVPGQRLSVEEFRAGYCLPDERAGRLEITADEKRRKVSVRVRLARGKT